MEIEFTVRAKVTGGFAHPRNLLGAIVNQNAVAGQGTITIRADVVGEVRATVDDGVWVVVPDSPGSAWPRDAIPIEENARST